MERLFSPCTRMYEILESQVEGLRGRPELLEELNLDVSTEELLFAERAFTCADLYTMLENEKTVAWLTPHAAVVRAEGGGVHSWGQLDESYRFIFSADGKEMVAFARSHEHLLEICDVVLRLLAASGVVHSLLLQGFRSRDAALINATSLEYLMEQCQSLKFLKFMDVDMDENHCRVLGAYSRPDLKIELQYCRIVGARASALAEVLGRNQGPTKLVTFYIDSVVLANGLRGNRRLKSLDIRFCGDTAAVANRELIAIASALKENKGLVNLTLVYDFRVSDETWNAVCDSLKTHPTLEAFSLRKNLFLQEVPFAPAARVLKSRLQALVDMLKVNMSIHIITVHAWYSNHELFQGSVVPYLQTNRFRPRLLAIQKTRPIAYRVKVLGRALLAVRTNPNSFWILLSGNPEVAFPSTTATTTLAANLLSRATAAVPAIITDVTAIRAASSTGASTSTNVDTPTACQKRKAHP